MDINYVDVNLINIRATELSTPPYWALLQRKLFSLINKAASLAAEKYARKSGLVYHAFDVDDMYESRSMRSLFYAMGGNEEILPIALREWNAITRLHDDGRLIPPGDPENPMFIPQLHNEYWNMSIPFNADWFHMGEGNQYFYNLCLADPTNPENRERARKFANLYTGDSPEAPNYDPRYKIIRSPFHGGAGPFLKCRTHKIIPHWSGEISGPIELVRHWLDSGSVGEVFGDGTPRVPAGFSFP